MRRINTRITHWFSSIVVLLMMPLAGAALWNNPHSAQHDAQNYLYMAFNHAPKTLDPARSYSADESLFIAQIYEPPLQYHYLKRPYTLVPLTLRKMPRVTYLDKQRRVLPDNAPEQNIAYSQYDLYLIPHIYYQPHAALARQQDGRYRYHHLPLAVLEGMSRLEDFTEQGTRELTADDYVYQIKRLADPTLHSPIYSVLSKYIVGFAALHRHLAELQTPVDLRRIAFQGAQVIDRYHYRILLQGKYPQFIYWLAMPFFAPVPWEAEHFYTQPGMVEKNITLGWHPIGTGPYMLVENNPNRRMVLQRNPNFHVETYPREGETSDKAQGLLQSAGQRLPFLERVIFSLERESIAYWNKFLQGYYDRSGIGSDNFEQAIVINNQGHAQLSETLSTQHIYLQTSVMLGTSYMGFNMLDKVVGGDSERARLLRQAIAIAMDYEEFIEIFQNGRGVVAHSPIPPGLLGYESGEVGMNSAVYTWRQGRAQRRSVQQAQALMRRAGYANGIDPQSHAPLRLYYDIAASGDPSDHALYTWLHKQFAKLGIDLHIRATQYNRFQEKMRHGNAQIFSWGWHADYPDPENFLFLLYGPNSKAKYDGENVANYTNPEYDALFIRMRSLENGPARAALIRQMIRILQHDAPWVWGSHPLQYQLHHGWNYPTKPHAVANNSIKYMRIDPLLRQQQRAEWNAPILWPLCIPIVLLIGLLLPVILEFWYKNHRSRKRYDHD